MEERFARSTAGYRTELVRHCRRILGSDNDAEDQVQEAYVRAWRAYGQLREPDSMRAWLGKIASRACFTELEKRKRRPMPSGMDGADERFADLELLPEAFSVRAPEADVAGIVADREEVAHALETMMGLLPRQRAVLMLCEVLRWKAAEAAELIGVTPAAVNSALQRARARLERGIRSTGGSRLSDAQRNLLHRYLAAIEHAEVADLVALARAEAVGRDLSEASHTIGACPSR